MREFFKGWRRKAGMVMLVMACVFAAGWVRSFSTADSLMFMTEPRGAFIAISMSGCVLNKRMPQMEGTPGTSWHSDDLSNQTQADFLKQFYDIQPNEMRIPYWSIVIPLTLLSACLLIAKPRPAKSPESPRR